MQEKVNADAPEAVGEVYVSGIRAELGDIRKVRVTHDYEYELSGEEGIA